MRSSPSPYGVGSAATNPDGKQEREDMIQAIETEYRGYRFRSRLEARWAVFFDAMGFTWRYEHEGFKRGGLRYLPDFELEWGNGKTMYVEVKGDRDALIKDHDRFSQLLDFGGCFPGFDDCYETNQTGLLLLGDIPSPEPGTWFHPIVRHHEGLHKSWACFKAPPQTIGIVVEDDLAVLLDLLPENCIEGAPEHWGVEERFRQTEKGFVGVINAYREAKQARFEHGERGRR